MSQLLDHTVLNLDRSSDVVVSLIGTISLIAHYIIVSISWCVSTQTDQLLSQCCCINLNVLQSKTVLEYEVRLSAECQGVVSTVQYQLLAKRYANGCIQSLILLHGNSYLTGTCCKSGSNLLCECRLNNLLYLDSLDHEWLLSPVLNVEAVSLQLSDSCLIRYSELITRTILRNADLIISNELLGSTLLED